MEEWRRSWAVSIARARVTRDLYFCGSRLADVPIGKAGQQVRALQMYLWGDGAPVEQNLNFYQNNPLGTRSLLELNATGPIANLSSGVLAMAAPVATIVDQATE